MNSRNTFYFVVKPYLDRSFCTYIFLSFIETRYRLYIRHIKIQEYLPPDFANEQARALSGNVFSLLSQAHNLRAFEVELWVRDMAQSWNYYQFHFRFDMIETRDWNHSLRCTSRHSMRKLLLEMDTYFKSVEAALSH